MINYGGIDRAKDRRGAAQQTQINSQLKGLSDNLVQLQTRQIALANITVEMRNVMKHLATFVVKSSILYDELRDLVSFELLIQPLNDILTELINNGVTIENIAGTSQISSIDIQSIQNTIAPFGKRILIISIDTSNILIRFV